MGLFYQRDNTHKKNTLSYTFKQILLHHLWPVNWHMETRQAHASNVEQFCSLYPTKRQYEAAQKCTGNLITISKILHLIYIYF